MSRKWLDWGHLWFSPSCHSSSVALGEFHSRQSGVEGTWSPLVEGISWHLMHHHSTLRLEQTFGSIRSNPCTSRDTQDYVQVGLKISKEGEMLTLRCCVANTQWSRSSRSVQWRSRSQGCPRRWAEIKRWGEMKTEAKLCSSPSELLTNRVVGAACSAPGQKLAGDSSSPMGQLFSFSPTLKDVVEKRSSLSIFVCKYYCYSLAMYSAHFTYLCTALRGSNFGGGKLKEKQKQD